MKNKIFPQKFKRKLSPKIYHYLHGGPNDHDVRYSHDCDIVSGRYTLPPSSISDAKGHALDLSFFPKIHQSYNIIHGQYSGHETTAFVSYDHRGLRTTSQPTIQQPRRLNTTNEASS